jgi:spermidine/putrescine transport system permease protein
MKRKSHFSLKLITALAFLILYVPIVVLVIYSFVNPAPTEAEPEFWTMMWYRKVFANRALLDALLVSAWVGVCTTVVATVLGTAATLAVERSKFPGRKLFSAVALMPLMTSEIMLGLSLLIWFVALNLTLGVFSIILAHVTFSISYVIVTVGARLQDFDRSLEDAARDLGASPWQTFWRVTFPLIWPGVLSGALMVFTLSFDDFLITFFTSGVGSDTLPLKLYSMIKFGLTPEVNALSTLLLLTTFVLVFFLTSQSGLKVLKRKVAGHQ